MSSSNRTGARTVEYSYASSNSNADDALTKYLNQKRIYDSASSLASPTMMGIAGNELKEAEKEVLRQKEKMEKELVDKKGQQEEGEIVNDLNELCNELRNPAVTEYITLDILKEINWTHLPYIENENYEKFTANQERLRRFTQCDVNELNFIMNRYNIDSCNRRAHFMSQVYHEIQQGDILLEGSGNENPINYFSNRDYREEYHHNAKGDGAKYRGAGLIQLTWKSQYELYRDYLKTKGIVDEKIVSHGAVYVAKNYAFDSAGWFWNNFKGVNQKCDETKSLGADEAVRIVTKAVNGGNNGLKERQAFYKLCREKFKCKD
jgi:predicted chitinase